MNEDELINSFKENPESTVLKFTQSVIEEIRENVRFNHDELTVINDINKDKFYDKIIDYYSALYSMFTHSDLFTKTHFKEPEGNIEQDIDSIFDVFYAISEEYRALCARRKFKSISDKYTGLFKNEFMYHFSDNEVDKIQELINILREEISKSTLFEEEHQQRLLKRLEKLQAEIHKKMSDLDRFWGLVGDAGVAIGKFGKDAKPIVDRIRELTDVVWGAQRRAEKLPDNSSNPLIDSES